MFPFSNESNQKTIRDRSSKVEIAFLLFFLFGDTGRIFVNHGPPMHDVHTHWSCTVPCSHRLNVVGIVEVTQRAVRLQKKPWTCVYVIANNVRVRWVSVWNLQCCQKHYRSGRRVRRSCPKDGAVVKKTHELVCMRQEEVWAWGGCRCECYNTVRNTIGRRVILCSKTKSRPPY